jgi:hypothetical protein
MVTANEMLLNIRNFLRQAPTEEMYKLWAVLTALRGPDFHHMAEYKFKRSTTAVIRKALLGVDDLPGIPAVIASDSWDGLDARKRLEDESAMGDATGNFIPPHFVQHAKNAFRALGLNWYEYNDPRKHDITVVVDGPSDRFGPCPLAQTPPSQAIKDTRKRHARKAAKKKK